MDLSERGRIERRLEAQYAAGRVLAQSVTLEDATPAFLHEVGRAIGWKVGTCWVVDEEAEVLRFVTHWADDVEAADFEKASRGRVFRRGEGLPGQVWASGKPAWISNVADDPNFPRSRSAAKAGLHAGFAFPINVGERVMGVIEFFTGEDQQPDEYLLGAMAVVGTEIGQFAERARAVEAVRASEARKSAILESALDCLISMDHEGRIIEFNPAAEKTFGYPRDEAVGRELAELIIPASLREQHRKGLTRYLETGAGTIMGRRVELTGMRSDGTELPVELAITRVDVPGPPVFTGYIRDITDRRRVERELREGESRLREALEREKAARGQAEERKDRIEFLAEASRLLSTSLSYERTLEKLAAFVVPRLADWCSIDAPEDGSIRQLALAHIDPQMTEMARTMRERYPPDPDSGEGVAQVLRTEESLLYSEIPTELLERVAVDEEHLRFLRELGMVSAMIVPLVARGRTIGAITFVASESGRRFDESDLALAEDLASRAAVSVDNARLYKERSYIARTLQQSLLPPGLPELPGMEIAARYHPAGAGNQVGGDFYDVFERSGGDWVVVVGDVCGKGPDAAAVTGLARHTLRASTIKERSPSRALELLNEALLRGTSDRFCTVACGRFERRGERVTVAVSCGGHPLPYLLRANGVAEPVGEHGTLLGTFGDIEVRDATVEMAVGDTIIFYTDGVVEDRRLETVQERRSLRSLVQHCAFLGSAEAVADCLEREVRRLHPDGPQDDIAIVVCRVVA